MARRRDSAGPAVPERLCRFLPAEWTGQDCWTAFDAWRAMRRTWAAENPASPLGDIVDMLIVERATRHRLAGVTPATNPTNRKEKS